MRKLLILALVLLLLHTIFINSITSRILFSERSTLSKSVALGEYVLKGLFRLLWELFWLLVKIGRYIFDVLVDWWFYFTSGGKPSYNIRSSRELYLLYQQVAQWSGLPWQVFWGIHAEETNLGRNLGTTPVMRVLSERQKKYFLQICRDLHWDPHRVLGSAKGAIGPFQFIPETWVRHAIDANNDGRKDPFDLEDAAYSAANYLLYKGGQRDLQKAIWHYNQSSRYVRRVMRYLHYS